MLLAVGKNQVQFYRYHNHIHFRDLHIDNMTVRILSGSLFPNPNLPIMTLLDLFQKLLVPTNGNRLGRLQLHIARLTLLQLSGQLGSNSSHRSRNLRR